MTRGRSCPIAYRYRPESLCETPEAVNADVIYVVGGLYGNPHALDEIERMVRVEQARGFTVQVVFNGDFNWFNARDDLFRSINERVLAHTVTLGNVDYEVAQSNPGAGCGCAYPDFVDQGVVDRSNLIMERLQAVAANHPELQSRLAELPRTRCLLFGGLKVLVVHGDPESLAGWGLAYEAFEARNDANLNDWFGRTGADAILSTHTCLPVLWQGEVEGRPRLIANNGSAGMGNLLSDPRGLVTRLSKIAPVEPPAVGVEMAGWYLSLMPVEFELEGWLADFDQLWPESSPAAVSYRNRILSGTALAPDDVIFPK